MSDKVIILCSSPHKDGNTNKVVKHVENYFNNNDHSTEVVDIAHLKYKSNGCIACFECQKSDEYKCVIKDDATPILERLHEYQYIIFATPIYFFGPNAQLKLILDRMFSLYKINIEVPEPPKSIIDKVKFGLIATAGGDIEGGLGLTDQSFKIMSGFTNTKYHSLLIECADSIKNISENDDIKAKAKTFVKEIIEA